MREIDVSVVIVSHNTRDLLGNCIRSVQDKTFDISYEIIVVDNASGDGSPELVKRDFPGVKLIANVGNLGFGKGNNLGMKEVSGKYYVFYFKDEKLPDKSVWEKEKEAYRRYLLTKTREEFFKSFTEGLRNKEKIKIDWKEI